MYNDLWKKIIIALTAFIGIQIVLVIIPGFVILLTTPNIINNISKVVSKISRPTKGRLLCYSIFGGNFG